MCSSAGRHGPMARRGVASGNIRRQSLQHTTEAISGYWSQHWRSSAASVQQITSATTWHHTSHRCRLTRKHICSGLWQSSYSATQLWARTTSRHHRWTSAELQVAKTSLLHGIVRTTAGWVWWWCCSVWCALSINKLFLWKLIICYYFGECHVQALC